VWEGSQYVNMRESVCGGEESSPARLASQMLIQTDKTTESLSRPLPPPPPTPHPPPLTPTPTPTASRTGVGRGV
jgi:hypothetical protein